MLAGTVFTYVGQQITNDQSTRKLEEKSDRVETLSRENISKTEEIAKLNQAIAEQSRRAEAYSRGEGSFCYLGISIFQKQSAAFGSLTNIGKNPLYDVRIRIIKDPHKTYPQAQGKAKFEILDQLSKQKTLVIGTLAPSNVENVAYPSETYRLELSNDSNFVAYTILFSARNDHFMQLIRFRKINGKWVFAYRVVQQMGKDTGKVLQPDFILEGYPTRADGTVDWDAV